MHRYLKPPFLLTAIVGAIRLVRRAAPRHLATVLAIDILAGAGAGLQIILTSWALTGLLASVHGPALPVSALVQVGLLLAVSAVLGLLNAAKPDLLTLLAELTGRYANDRILDVATRVDLAAFDTSQFYDRLQRAQSAAASRPYALTLDLTTLISTASGAVGLLVSLITLQPLLIPVALIAFIPHVVATRKNSRARHVFGLEMTPDDRQRSYLAGLLTGKTAAQEIRAFDAANFLRTRYERLYQQRIARVRAVTRERMGRSLWASAAQSMVWILIVAGVVALLVTHRTTVGVAVASVLAIQQLSTRLMFMTRSSATMQENALFLRDLDEFLATPTETQTPDNAPLALTAPPFTGVRLDHVTFTYPGSVKPAVKDVTIDLRQGEIIGLVGENGSGKTTLVKLISQLYRPTAGTVLWSGEDAAHYDPQQLRAMVAVLFQDYMHYSISAADNIAVGHPAKAGDLPAIEDAAIAAGIDERIRELPESYQTILGREFYGGHELSIGQWQRLALARAFLRDAPLIILDEPTAALDPRAEHRVFQQVRALARGRTVLLISHRVASMRAADRIYVLSQGTVVESGNHNNLMAQDGLYADLYTLQASTFEQGLIRKDT